jgi:hypothetical protein
MTWNNRQSRHFRVFRLQVFIHANQCPSVATNVFPPDPWPTRPRDSPQVLASYQEGPRLRVGLVVLTDPQIGEI